MRRGPRAAAPCAAGPGPGGSRTALEDARQRRALELDLADVAGHVDGQERDPVAPARSSSPGSGSAATARGRRRRPAGEQAAEEGERVTAGLGAALAGAAGQRDRALDAPHHVRHLVADEQDLLDRRRSPGSSATVGASSRLVSAACTPWPCDADREHAPALPGVVGPGAGRLDPDPLAEHVRHGEAAHVGDAAGGQRRQGIRNQSLA